MKKLLILALLVGAGWAIYRYALVPMTPLATLPATELKEGEKAKEVAQEKVNQALVSQIQEMVNGYRDRYGSLPASLQDLVDKGLIDHVPSGIVYDPQTGKVSAG